MSSVLRVLHVSAGNLYGGIETLLVTLARHRGLCPAMEPHFACCFDGRLTDELRASGAPVHDLGEVRVRWPWTVWLARRRLRRLLRREGFEVVVCHSTWPQAVFGPAARAERAPLVFWLHDAPGGRHWVERWASRTAPDLAICNSRFTAGLLPALYPQVRGEVIYCPVPPAPVALSPERRRSIRLELQTPPDAVVLLQASRLEAWKGHPFLLEALGAIKAERDWVLWVAGGAQRPEEEAYLQGLHALAAKLGIGERARFLGQRSDVRALMAAADVYCQLNKEPEPFGIVFIEALYAGLPVVTAAFGGGAEIVDETCGALLSLNDTPEDAAGRLQGLLRDTNLRARLGAGGPARARQLCDPKTQLDRLGSVLRTAVDPEVPVGC